MTMYSRSGVSKSSINCTMFPCRKRRSIETSFSICCSLPRQLALSMIFSANLNLRALRHNSNLGFGDTIHTIDGNTDSSVRDLYITLDTSTQQTLTHTRLHRRRKLWFIYMTQNLLSVLDFNVKMLNWPQITS